MDGAGVHRVIGLAADGPQRERFSQELNGVGCLRPLDLAGAL